MSNIVDSDFLVPITICDADDEAVDVSSWTLEVQWFRSGPKNCSPVFKLTDGITKPNGGSDGLINVVLTAAQTKQLGAGNARVVIWRTDSGNRVVIAEGSAPFESLGYDA